MQPAVEPTGVPQSILDAIARTHQLFLDEVVANRNLDALDRVYTAHARILPPGLPVIEGRDNIKSFWKRAIVARDVASATLETLSTDAAGDSVLEVGRADLTLAAGGVDKIKYFVQWKQEDGEWKLNVDIWNPLS